VLNDLDEDALVEILSKPKNAIVKQYQRLFEFENLKLRFTEDALRSGAQSQTQSRSRGLRADSRRTHARP
jgi:ATP-dependent Clp protease ATP-binding subunit ClpX